MGTALLVEYYNELPDLQADDQKGHEAHLRAALDSFKKKVAARYSEGTLQRVLESSDVRARRAAALALGLVGTMQANASLAAVLHDEDRLVRQQAADGLWSLWFRASSEENTQELQRLMRLRDTAQETGRTQHPCSEDPAVCRGLQSAGDPVFPARRLFQVDRRLRARPQAESVSLRRPGRHGGNVTCVSAKPARH